MAEMASERNHLAHPGVYLFERQHLTGDFVFGRSRMKSFIASLIAALCVATVSAQSNSQNSSQAIANQPSNVAPNATANARPLPDVTATNATTSNVSKAQITTPKISAKVQSATTDDLIKSTEMAKSASQELLQLQQQNVTKLAASVAQLQQLYNEGLIARVEFEKAQNELADAQATVTETENEIASSTKLATEIKKASELDKIGQTNKLLKPVLKSINTSGATVMRSTSGNWSLANLSQVQQFFSQTFGHALPVSTLGQSVTHNRMGWDHRNSVDIGIHPDSREGRALMSYLQLSGIPFLAFRAAVPGVSTGPHIHIGFPSHRLG